MKKPRVLVTGAGGFIGTSLIKELWRRKCEVVYFDLIDPKIEGIERMNLGTVLDPHDLAMAVRGCDYAIHLAALLGVHRTETNRLECLHINIKGTLNFIEACIKEGVRKIAFSSSSEVYGEQAVQPVKEDSALNAKSVYAVSKLVGEQYLQAYSEMYDIEYNIVRFFNVYGEHQNDCFVLSKFIRSAIMGEPLTVYGDGEQVRSFCYVDDAVRGLAEVVFSGRSGDVYNIGNDLEPIAIKDLAEKIIRLSGKAAQPVFLPYERADRSVARDVKKRIPSIDKARRELGYEPKCPLDKGLERLIAFYLNNLE
jgi:UDP-glucose 4-epimerase